MCTASVPPFLIRFHVLFSIFLWFGLLRRGLRLKVGVRVVHFRRQEGSALGS